MRSPLTSLCPDYAQTPTDERQPVMDAHPRRTFDLLVCVLATPLLIVVAAIVAICVFVDSPGPLLYRSRRVGRNGETFWMLKFRTMRHGASGPPLSCLGDERFTPFGRVLARSRLDELPQVINVLRGEMALVGPRPELREFVDANPEQYAVILAQPPGLTGPAQLRFAGEGRMLMASEDRVAVYTQSILPAKLAVDVEYVRTASVRTDLRVLCRTLLLPARLVGDALCAWRAKRTIARPTASTVLVAAASLAVMVVFSVDAVSGV